MVAVHAPTDSRYLQNDGCALEINTVLPLAVGQRGRMSSG